MTAFQWIAIPLLLIAAGSDLFRLIRGAGKRRFRLLRLATWTVAAVLILFPESTTRVAGLVGIGQGKDLVFYIFILATLVAAFGFYAKCQSLERQITALIRAEAIRNAEAPCELNSVSD